MDEINNGNIIRAIKSKFNSDALKYKNFEYSQNDIQKNSGVSFYAISDEQDELQKKRMIRGNVKFAISGFAKLEISHTKNFVQQQTTKKLIFHDKQANDHLIMNQLIVSQVEFEVANAICAIAEFSS